MPRAHIGLIVTHAVSFNTLMRGQLEYLASQEIALTVYCGGSHEDVGRLISRGVAKVRFVPLRRPPHPLWDIVCLIQLVIELSRQRFDALVCSTPKAMLLGSLAGWITMQPNRTAVVRGRAYEGFRGFKRQIYLLLDWIAFACVNRIIFISPSLLASYREDGLQLKGKAGVLGYGSSNGVDLKRFRPPAAGEIAVERTKLGLDPGAFVILIAGRLAKDKGIFDVIEMIRSIPTGEISWVFVGGVESDEALRQINDLADRNVRYVSHTDRIEAWFRAADLHLFLTHREGFGNVAIEAAACGTPTFAYDVVGVRDSVVSGSTGELFPKDNPAPLRQAIIEAYSCPSDFRARYKSITSVVQDRFEQSKVWSLYASASLP